MIRKISWMLLALLVLAGCRAGSQLLSSGTLNKIIEEVIIEAVDEKVNNKLLPQETVWKKDGAQMVRIPDMYLKGDDEITPLGEKYKSGDDFLMDVHEVTRGQFRKFLLETGYDFNGRLWAKIDQISPTDEHPMTYVTFEDTEAYCKWAGKRLPTEEEWEWAARGGLVGKEYMWGDDEGQARDYANYFGAGGKDRWSESTAPVGSLKPNGYGVFDMGGNVFEWCRGGVLRGGSWNSRTSLLRVAYRYHGGSEDGDYYHGFRCVSGMP